MLNPYFTIAFVLSYLGRKEKSEGEVPALDGWTLIIMVEIDGIYQTFFL